MAKHSISVVLCTYNGKAFLPAQLASLERQVRPPEELVVRDDGSTDGTMEVLEEFAANAPFPVRFARNEERLGIPANFLAAIGDARGDLLALCDQDDVWMPSRLQRAAEILEGDPEVGGTFSDGTCIDATGSPTGTTLWQSAGFTAGVQSTFEAGEQFRTILDRPVVTGATLTFRAELRPLLTPWPVVTHDHWISAVIAARSRLVGIPSPLISYRLHGGNAVGFRGRRRAYVEKILTRDRRVAEIDAELSLLEHVAALSGLGLCPNLTDELDGFVAAKIELLQFRRELPRRAWRRFPPVLERVLRGDYARLAHGAPTWLHDLLRS